VLDIEGGDELKPIETGATSDFGAVGFTGTGSLIVNSASPSGMGAIIAAHPDGSNGYLRDSGWVDLLLGDDLWYRAYGNGAPCRIWRATITKTLTNPGDRRVRRRHLRQLRSSLLGDGQRNGWRARVPTVGSIDGNDG
jgi:hypothetical protein